MAEKGMLVVFSGPSGAGKGTVLKEFFRHATGTVYSVSATTRRPRPGEVDGRDYFFVTRARFEEMIAAGEVLEHTEYNGNYYGSPAEPIRRQLEAGSNVLLEIEVDGAAQVRRRFPEALSIFVAPPSFSELRRRLDRRHTETEAEVAARLEAARGELRAAAEYDYILINDVVEDAARRLEAILVAARCSRKYNEGLLRAMLAE